MEQATLLSATKTPYLSSPDLEKLHEIVRVLIRHGYVLENSAGVTIGKRGKELEPQNPCCFVTEEDPTDPPKRFQPLLCLIGRAQPRRRIVTMQIVMRNPQNALVDFYDPRDTEKVTRLGKLLAQKLRIVVTPSPKSRTPLTKTISVRPAPS